MKKPTVHITRIKSNILYKCNTAIDEFVSSSLNINFALTLELLKYLDLPSRQQCPSHKRKQQWFNVRKRQFCELRSSSVYVALNLKQPQLKITK